MTSLGKLLLELIRYLVKSILSDEAAQCVATCKAKGKMSSLQQQTSPWSKANRRLIDVK